MTNQKNANRLLGGRVLAVMIALSALVPYVRGGEITFLPGQTEVVIVPKAPSVVQFSGREMTNYLSRVLGCEVPIVSQPSDGRQAIILGDNTWSRAAGLDSSTLETDAFIVKAIANRVYIVGCDSARLNMHVYMKGEGYGTLIGHDRATLHGVYDFLERYAGVRFYFPDDELGVIVPRRAQLNIPEGTRTVTPDYLLRDPYFAGDGKWHITTSGGMHVKTAHWLRLRLASTSIPCCHGSRNFQYIERFGKTHPEYLALRKDGSRVLDPKKFAAYQYCWSNPAFREELYQDVKAYLTGQKPETRGLKAWPRTCRYGKWVDIMPEDAFQGCYCKACQKAYSQAADKTHYATELVWGATAEIGNRLLAEGVPGNITMMSYRPYSNVPDFALPSNVWTMVAVGGPWSMTNPTTLAEQVNIIRKWRQKLGHKIWIWTYPSKFGNMMIPGIPCVGPHAWGKFYADLKDDILGGFCECECDRAIYNFLNYYVYSRVMWDATTNIDAVLDELYADLFGAGRAEMKQFFAALEDTWTKRVVGRVVDTTLGPQIIRPTNAELWRKIYSPSFRQELNTLLKAAEAKVASQSREAKRLALMRAEFYDRMCAGAEAYEAECAKVDALRFEAAKGSVTVSALNSGPRAFTNVASVATVVQAQRTPRALVFNFVCEEPKIDLASEAYLTRGDVNCWQDNTVEIIMNPSGDDKTCFHYIVTSAGNLAGQRYEVGSGLPPVREGIIDGVNTTVTKTTTGWKGTIEIPLAVLGKVQDAFRINFCRHRRLTDGTAEPISWSPYVQTFHDLLHFGTIVFAASAGNEANPDAVELAPIPRPLESSTNMDAPVPFDASTTITLACPDATARTWLTDHLTAWYGALAPHVVAGTVDLPLKDGAEAYAVTANTAGVQIAARTLAGVRWAAYSLRQMAIAKRGTMKTAGRLLPTLTISDAPHLAFRGIHICWFPELRTEQIERAIRLAAMMKFNHVVLEPWGMYRSARHPWWSWPDAKMTKAEVRRLVAIGRDLGVTLIPQIPVYGHAAAGRSCTLKHSVLDLQPEYEPLFEPGGWNWCLTNPETQKVLRELIVELLEDFGHPPYIHLGCDEAQPPTCPDCRKRPYGELVCEHISNLAAFAKTHGARAMIWHDMLLDAADPRWNGFVKSGSALTAKMVDTLPRDIIICDWQYSYDDMAEIRKTWPTMKYFKDKGLSVVGCPWRNYDAMKSMADYLAEIGGFGLLETTWHRMRGTDWATMFSTASAAAWGAQPEPDYKHGTSPQWNTRFSIALRLVGHDMKLTDYRDTGHVSYQVPPAWWVDK